MTDPRPATRHHDPHCRGCGEYAILLGRETTARAQFCASSKTAHDALRELRSQVVGYLRARHPLRTEDLKQRGHPLGPDTETSVLLGALAQWDQIRDAALRKEITHGVENDVAALRAHITDLERQREHEGPRDRVRELTEQNDSLTAQLAERDADRQELSRAVTCLADHITASGGTLPAMPRPYDWYRRWAPGDHVPGPRATDQPADDRSPARALTLASTSDAHRSLRDHYEADWGQALLRRLWAGSLWTRQQILSESARERSEAFVEELIQHGLLAVEDPDQAQILAATAHLGAFARDLGAQLGPQRPSPAARVIEAMTAVETQARVAVLRAMAAAGRDHHLTTVHCPSDRLPLLGVRPRTGPRMPTRWLLPWLPAHTPLVTDLLERARGRDPEAGLTVVVRRQGDGADDADWGEPVRAAGFDPAAVKRIWLDPPST